jgi:microcystin-dependent protein
VGAQSSYPALWAVAPAAWKSGSDLVLPDLGDTILIQADTIATLGATGGSNTRTLTTNELPAHTHTGPSHTHSTPAHQHTGTTSTNGAHTHTTPQGASTGSSSDNLASSIADLSATLPLTSSDGSHNHTFTTDSGGSGTTGAGGTGATGSAGSGSAFSIAQLSLGVTYQIKAH